MPAWLSDEFNGAGNLVAHVPDVGQPGLTWRNDYPLTGNTQFVVSGGAATPTVSNPDPVIYGPASAPPPVDTELVPAGCEVTAVIRTGSGSRYFEITIRGGVETSYSADRAFLTVALSGTFNTVAISSKEGGSTVVSYTFAANTTYTVRFVVTSTSAQVFINEVLVATRTLVAVVYVQTVKLFAVIDNFFESLLVTQGAAAPPALPFWADYINTYEVA